MHWVHYISKELADLSGLINAISAFSTFAAVVISLKLARAIHSPKLTTLAYVGQILNPEGEGSYSKSKTGDNIALSIQNRGPLPVTLTISAFNWRFWRHEKAMMQPPVSPDLRQGNLVIPPAEGRLVILTDRIEDLRNGMLEQKLWFLRWRMRLEIHGSDGIVHYAKLSKGIRRLLSSKTS